MKRPPLGGGEDRLGTTLVVAAIDSLYPERADYQCLGIADDVQINLALNTLPAQGGRIMFSEGQFVLTNPIIIPNNDIVLEGQGWSTFINGNNLLTGNHGIQVSGWDNCQIKNLKIRTQAGGGKVCHCIFAEDGCHDLRIENIYFEDSDSDAIHIEGTSTSRVQILNCFIEGADNHGIHITPDVLDQTASFQIYNNHIQSCGIDGIHFTTCAGHRYHIISENHIESCANSGIQAAEWLMECEIVGNYIRANTFDGIQFLANCDNNLIENNYCNSNGAYGIVIAAVTCSENRLKNNKLIGNTLGAIVDMGTLTQLPFIFVPVPEPGTVIGTHPATLLTDGLAVTDRIELYIPIEFQELVRAHVVLVPGGTGNLRRSVTTNWGMIGSGETYNANADAIAAGEIAVTANWLEQLDIRAAFNGPPPVAAGDAVGIEFTRHGNHANDTVNANCYLLGVRIEYV
jgi:parallel beta-helix repeat protein